MNLNIGTRVAASVLAMAAVLAACAPADGSPPLAASDRSDLFVLSISTPKHDWAVEEEIEVTGSLSYLGAGETTIWGSGGGLLAFDLVELTGDRHLEGGTTLECRSQGISAAASIVRPYGKSGGWDPADPKDAWYGEFFADPLFRLPAGRWRVTPWSRFSTGLTCSADEVWLRASVEITVR